MTMYALQFFGTFNLTADDVAITRFHSDKARALLAYVAVEHQQLHNRTTLAALFWPESTARSALTNVRNVLANLRKIAPDLLEITRSTVRWRGNGTVDVQQFVTSIAADPATALPHYHGDFLDGLTLPDATDFDEWRLVQQEQLHQQMMGGLERLAADAIAEHAYTQAVDYAKRQLSEVAWHEPAHRTLMTALMAQGKRAAALQQFERCRAVLADALGVEPSAATLALVAEISAEKTIRHNLPPRSTQLIGRANLQTQLTQAITSHQLVTVTGVGGVGKSSLALAAVRQLLDAPNPPFPGGLWFVPLAGIDGTGAVEAQLLAAIGGALDLRVETIDDLTHALREKRLLLLLDNFEQLVQSAESVLHKLLHETSVHLLITSRVRTQLPTERRFALHGLSLPAAVSLFRERARQVNASFAAPNEAIRPIVEQVEGLPLAIELAASWVEHFTLDELRDAINTDLAASDTVDLPDRHHNLRAIFDHSWHWLSENERRTLVQLSVFRGTLRREAVLAVTDATLNHLSALRSKSLLRLEAAGTYSLHEVIREFSAEKGTAHGTLAPAQQAHADYFLTELHAKYGAAMRDEADNVRAAWEYAHNPPNLPLLTSSAGAFGILIETVGLLTEIEERLSRSCKQIGRLPKSKARDDLLARLYLSMAFTAPAKKGIELTQAGLIYATEPETLIKLHAELAAHYAELNLHREAVDHLNQQLELAQRSEDTALHAYALSELAAHRALHFVGDYGSSIDQLEAILPSLLANKNPDTIHNLRKILVSTYMRYGDYGRALAVVADMFDQITDRTSFIYADTLLDEGLSLTFAGQERKAIKVFEQSLALAKQQNDAVGIGLLHANLCLAYRRIGAPDVALQHGRIAIEQLTRLQQARMLGQATTRVGHALLMLEQWEKSAEAYHAALAIWEPADHPNQYEARAGLAVALQKLGKNDEASRQIAHVLNFATLPQLERVVEPDLMLWNGITVLRALGRSADATTLLTLGQQWVEMIVGRNDSAEIHASFLSRDAVRKLLTG